MTTAYTSLLGLALPVTGELSGAWGDTVNTAITTLLDSAVAGTTSLTTDSDVTLTTTTGAANEARQAIILWNPASGTTTRNITAPAQSKIYTVINASGGTQSIVFRGAGPTTGVTIVKGESAVVAWNGTDFIKVSNTSGAGAFTNLTVTGNTILGDASGDTITVNGTTTFANVNPTLTAGTANGVAYLNGSKVLTTGSALTFDGTNFGVGTASPTPYQAGSRVVQINSATANAEIKLTNTTSGSAATDGLMLAQWGNDAYLWNGEAGGILFGTSNQEQMRLTSTGLGIGTSSPAYKLTVEGTLAAKRASANQYIAMSTTAGEGYLDTINTLSTDNIAFIFRQTNTGGTTTRMTLDSSGNLGLGVTPSVWGGSGTRAIQVGASGFPAFVADVGGDAWFGYNSSYDGTNWRYRGSFNATGIQQTAGAFRFLTAPSGTAGNSISFTQAMTLDASGNRMLGTTTASAVGGYITDTINGSSGSFTEWQQGGSNNFRVGSDSSAGGFLFTTGATPIRFGTNGTERARIDSSGSLLIGTTIPAGSTGSVGVRKGGTGELILLADNGGLFQQALGNYYLVTTSGGNTSDATLKKNVQQLSGALAKVCAIRGVNFEFIAEQKSTPDNGVQLGVIAQEVEAQYPEIVVTNEDGIKSVRYDRLVAPLIEAIKELKAEFDAYKASHP
jgi:hypothetical protein